VVRRGFKTKREAQEALLEAESALRTGRVVAGGRTMTFGAFLTDRWLPTIETSPRLKPKTKDGYQCQARRLVERLGQVRLDDLAGDDLTRLYAELRAEGKAERTVRYVHVTARKALGDAVRWRLLAWNPATEAEAPAQTPADPKAWTPDEVADLMVVCDVNRWAPLWRLAADSAARRGELAALRWPDLDLDAGTLTIARNLVVVQHRLYEQTPKNGRARTVALTAATVEALRAWRRQQGEERIAMGGAWTGEDRVFCWPDGSMLHPSVITRTFKRLVAEAGVPPLRLHSLRHAWATAALRAGVRTKVVADRLGHASTRITEDIYTAHVGELDVAAAETVAALYGGRPQGG
jgi:integrase